MNLQIILVFEIAFFSKLYHLILSAYFLQMIINEYVLI